MRSTRCSPAGTALQVAVGDDAHWHHPWDRFGAWVQVRAQRPDPRLLLQALKAGAYYSTQGPRIDEVRVEAGLVHVTCSPARAIALTGIHGWRSDVALGDPTRREATLELSRLRSPFWRLTVTGARREARVDEPGLVLRSPATGYPPWSVRTRLHGRESPGRPVG